MHTTSARASRIAVALCAIAGMSTTTFAQDNAHPKNQKLSVAFDVGFAPFAFKKGSGEAAGFSLDFAAAIADELGRPGIDVIDVNYASIFAGLFSGRYEMIGAPTNITKERAEQMLFSEPYLPTGLGFLVKGDGTLSSVEELKGKAVTVNNGSVADTWASENAETIGFEVQRYNKNADAVQAVMIGRAFANIADAPVSRYIATQVPNTSVPLVLQTGRSFGLAFRPDDTEFRDAVDQAIECLKSNGTLAEIHEKWFGVEPDSGTTATEIFAGYGAPGFKGHDESVHTASCK